MPTFLTTGYAWPGVGNMVGAPLTLVIDDDDASMDWFGADTGTPQTVEVNGNPAATFGGGTISISFTDSGATPHTEVFNAIFVSGFGWVIVPQPGSNFDGGSTVTGLPNGGTVDTAGFNYDDVFCFVAGSLIDTIDGKRPVEDIEIGDEVLTRNSGVQTVKWVGKRNISSSILRQKPNLRPVLFKQSSIAKNVPDRDMHVSPQHRMHLSGANVKLLFWENEVLAPAKSMINDHSILADHGHSDVTYVHIMFDKHEIVRVDGCWSESFYPGKVGLKAVDHNARRELFQIFPDLKSGNNPMKLCLPVLSVQEAQLLGTNAIYQH